MSIFPLFLAVMPTTIDGSAFMFLIFALSTMSCAALVASRQDARTWQAYAVVDAARLAQARSEKAIHRCRAEAIAQLYAAVAEETSDLDHDKVEEIMRLAHAALGRFAGVIRPHATGG